jgi:hypothetical protein
MKPIQKGKKKRVDDLSVTVPVRLSDCLVTDTRPDTARPVPYHSRTGHFLPLDCNVMQTELNNISEYCEQNLMEMNQSKSKCMLFNRSKKFDFTPELTI